MKAFQLKITLRDSSPSIWRRVVVPSDVVLGALHAVIQRSFGWENCHLHAFVVRGVHYGEPDDSGFGQPVHDEWLAHLCDVATRRSKLLYEYDFGDSWEHEIIVEKVLERIEGEGETCCVCLDGERAAPPEDSGGVWGYEEKLEILADPNHEDYEEMREWMGPCFSPDAFDLATINQELAALAATWTRPKAQPTTNAKPKAEPKANAKPSRQPRAAKSSTLQ